MAASVPRQWTTGDKLTAQDLNGNFQALCDAINALAPEPIINELVELREKCEALEVRVEELENP